MLTLAAEGSYLPFQGFSAWLTANAEIHLVRSDFAPTKDDTAASFDECQFPGYTPLPFPDLHILGYIAGEGIVARHLRQVWTATGPNAESVYGYYVTGPGGLLLWAERVAFSVPMGTTGFTYTLFPSYTIPLP